MKKRLLSLMTTILLLASFVPTEALAVSGRENPSARMGASTEFKNQDESGVSFETDSAVYINPIYRDVITEGDIKVPEEIETSENSSANGISTFSNDTDTPMYCTTVEEAGTVLRMGMVAREETITVYY